MLILAADGVASWGRRVGSKLTSKTLFLQRGMGLPFAFSASVAGFLLAFLLLKSSLFNSLPQF